MAKISLLLQKQKSRYIIIGLSVYVIELLVIYSVQLLGSSTTAAVGISFWIGLLVSFVLQKFITFQDRRIKKAVLVPQVMAVSILVLWNFAFTLGCSWLLSSKLPAFLIRTLALGITTMWNFYLYKSKIFHDENFIPVD